MDARASLAEGNRVCFYCPGCSSVHCITTGVWGWNEDLERPTFQPSVKVGGVQWAPDDTFHKPSHHVAQGEQICCHSFVEDGQIRFLDDSTHSLAGQTVELPSWPFL